MVHLPSKSARGQNVPAARNPFAMLRQEMEDLFSRFWDVEDEGVFAGGYSPSVDLSETPNGFELRMDIPGMEAKDIDVQVHGNMITLRGQRSEEKEEKDKMYHRMERRTGSFSRTVTLPCAVNEDDVSAEYHQGVLTVRLPKCEEAKTKKINVNG